MFKAGWVKDKHDSRDKLYFSKFLGDIKSAESTFPKSVDLREQMSTVENQGQLGSCTANSVVAMFEYLDKKDDQKYTDYSRLFLYYNTRLIEGTVFVDNGASLRDTIKSAARFGVCAETGWFGWPYNIEKYRIKPTFWCYWNARKVVAKEYLRLSNRIEALKHCLIQGFPFVFGFMVYPSFMNCPDINTVGKLPMPGKKEEALGGHAICAVGYDDDMECFIIRNSWGEDWGIKGYFYMPYQFIENSDYCNDFWTVMRY